MSNDFIPVSRWGKDHWTTLAYVDTVMVDCAGFQIGKDSRMKSNRRNFRIMHEQCPEPKRSGNAFPSQAMAMQPQHATRLRDGTVVESHDDWCVLQDMAEVGLFNVTADELDPGVTIHLSDLGREVVAAMRQHKSSGGQYATFDPVTSGVLRVTAAA